VVNRAGSLRRVNRMLIASQKTNGAAREGAGGTRSAYSRWGRSKYPRLRQGLWTCAVDPVMHRCRWIVLHKFMTGKCETRANARMAGRRRIVLVNLGGVSLPPRGATPPVDVNYCRFQRTEYFLEKDRMPISHRIISPHEVQFIRDVSVSLYIFRIIIRFFVFGWYW